MIADIEQEHKMKELNRRVPMKECWTEEEENEEEITRQWRELNDRSFMICTAHQILFRR